MVWTSTEVSIKVVSLDPPPFKLDRRIKNLERLELILPANDSKEGKIKIKIRLSGIQ